MNKEKASAPPVIEPNKTTVGVVESTPLDTLPRQDKPTPVAVQVDDFKQGVLYTLYILYKANMLSRHNLREAVQVMNRAVPEGGVAKYIVDEAAKA